MMKTVGRILAGMLVLALFAAPAIGQSGSGYYWFQVVDQDGQPFREDGVFNCSVYDGSANAPAALHTSATFKVGLAQPIYTDVSGKAHFFSSSATSYSVQCFSKYGDSGVINKLSRQVHKMVVDTNRAQKISRFQYTTNASPTATSLVIPKGGMVREVLVYPASVPQATAAHLNVSFGGNHSVSSWNALLTEVPVHGGYNLPAPLRGHRGVGGLCSGTGCSYSATRGLALEPRHSSAVAVPTEIPYLVHVSSGLQVTYNTSNVASIGGHVYILWTQTHAGALGQPLR